MSKRSWSISTEIVIEAPCARVWRILLDVQRYPEWNPLIQELHGVLRVEERIKFRFELPRGFRMYASAKVLSVAPDRELRWAGSLLFPWFLCAEHFHLIEPISDSALRFRHGEIFSGLLLPVVWLALRRSGPLVYQAVNESLKRRAEYPV